MNDHQVSDHLKPNCDDMTHITQKPSEKNDTWTLRMDVSAPGHTVMWDILILSVWNQQQSA